MQQKNNSSGGSLKSYFTLIVIVLTIIVSFVFFFMVMGSKSNFQDGKVEGAPVKDGIGWLFGTIYKGGFIVPVIISLLLMVITFSIERFLTLTKASGNGNLDSFMVRIRGLLSSNNIDAAVAECDKQKGSVGNVVKTGLAKYKQMYAQPGLDKDQKMAAIQKELEEATTLELPMLNKNLVVLSTVASIATLMGLLGTVLGMIKAFSALATSGAPDAAALSTGISEALINTAFGIGTSAVAIIIYNAFTSKIDSLTYRIDEAGFSISQTFASNYHD